MTRSPGSYTIVKYKMPQTSDLCPVGANWNLSKATEVLFSPSVGIVLSRDGETLDNS
jgi:hypothetical protein